MIDYSLMPELPKADIGQEDWPYPVEDYFIAPQMTAYGLQCYQLAMERAAQAVEAEAVEDTGHDCDKGYNMAIRHCAAAIRALALQNPALERMARIDDELGEQP